jgi:hypothetical protein
VTRLDESDNRLGLKVDIGIYKHKVLGIILLHKPTNGNISGAVDEALILSRVNVQLDPLPNQEELELEDTNGKLLKAEATIAGSAQKEFHHYTSSLAVL